MIQVIGIGSWDRSGSTILASTLGSAEGVVSVGELNNLWIRGLRDNRPCGCGEPFFDCPFWRKVMEHGFGDVWGTGLFDQILKASTRLSNQRMIRRRFSRHPDPHARVYAEGLARLYDGIAAVSGASVIIDSSKIPWHLDLIDRTGHYVGWYLHLIRDPRGVVNSHKKVVAYDPDRKDPVEMARRGALFTTAGWGFRNSLIGLLWGDDPHYMRVNYEDFVREPRTWATRILNRIGIDDPDLPFTTNDSLVMPTGHLVSGNPSRFNAGHVRIRADETWRAGLGSIEETAVATVTFPWRLAYRRSLTDPSPSKKEKA